MTLGDSRLGSAGFITAANVGSTKTDSTQTAVGIGPPELVEPTTMTEYDADAQESTDTTCPTCGKDDFSSEQYMKVHHARVHGESIAGVSFECDYCGETNRRKQSHLGEQNFCGKDCWYAWKSENHVGEKNHQWKGGPDEHTCEWCGDTYPEHRSDRTRFCSPRCRARGAAKRGPDSHLWQGGEWKATSRRGPNWEEQRRKALERDDYTCQYCGEHADDVPRMHVHHITPFDAFESYKKANELANLVSLCAACHAFIEQKFTPLLPPDMEIDHDIR